jgi:pimeloyl-ACP methyl ester carboxylesterase
MTEAAGQFEDVGYSAPDGLRLNMRVYGQDKEGGRNVVCLPGLTRNARDFHELALFLAARPGIGRVVAFDYRGRGRSAHDPNWQNYNVPTEAADVMAGAAALGIGRACFIGTSRGGLIILALAAMRPGLLESVILNDIGPVIEGDGLAQIRAYLTRTPGFSSFEEAVAFQKSVHGTSFPALGDEDWSRMVEALYRSESGRLLPDYDPNLVKTLTSIDFSKPLPVLWPQFEGLANIPLMVIRGSHSRLLSQATVEEMAARHPGMVFISAEGQGHAPQLETGDLPARIADFIERRP